jgi:hypothetical protein
LRDELATRLKLGDFRDIAAQLLLTGLQLLDCLLQ